MFINTSIFKKLIKEAYNSVGLTVGKEDKEYIIEGGYWVIRTDETVIPNKEKAAIMELAGELPEDGQIYKTLKDAPLQYEFAYPEEYNIDRNEFLKGTILKVTSISMKQNLATSRLLQDESSNEIYLVDETFIKLIEKKMLTTKEDTPVGPFMLPDSPYIVYWHNQHCCLKVCLRRKEEGTLQNQIIHYLEKIELEESEND